jgi:LPS-assembly lipoprotein
MSWYNSAILGVRNMVGSPRRRGATEGRDKLFSAPLWLCGSSVRSAGFSLVILALSLAGCGWQPLYGKIDDSGGNAGEELASVHILPIADRTGQNLYNALRDRMNPRGVPAQPQYDLVIRMSERSEQMLILEDQTASRINLTLYANYTLYQRGNKTPILQGQSQITTSYDYLANFYSTVTSEADAHRRGARNLADDISNRLAVFLARQQG